MARPRSTRRSSAAFTAGGDHGARYGGPHIGGEAAKRNLELLDTTCPLVTKVQRLAQKLVSQGYFLVVYGDGYHPEVRSVIGWADTNRRLRPRKSRAAVECRPWRIGRRQGHPAAQGRAGEPDHQEHRRVDGVRRQLTGDGYPRWGRSALCNTICEPTTERQQALRRNVDEVDLILAIGGRKSSNTARLADVGNQMGVPSYHIERAEEIDDEWLDDVAMSVLRPGHLPRMT